MYKGPNVNKTRTATAIMPVQNKHGATSPSTSVPLLLPLPAPLPPADWLSGPTHDYHHLPLPNRAWGDHLDAHPAPLCHHPFLLFTRARRGTPTPATITSLPTAPQ